MHTVQWSRMCLVNQIEINVTSPVCFSFTEATILQVGKEDRDWFHQFGLVGQRLFALQKLQYSRVPFKPNTVHTKGSSLPKSNDES